MKVGASFFFQNYFRAQKPDWEIYREDLALAEMVEPLGFDSIWGVEHHFSPYTMIPDVLQFLTFMAGRTRRVGFGSMVVVLPWHDPVRVAEQIAMLELYCEDRELTLGFGRGAGRIEYDGFRVPMSESRERFSEAAEVVRLGLTQERFSYKGKYFQIPEMSIRPQPRRAKSPRALLRRDHFARDRRHHGAAGDGHAGDSAEGVERAQEGLRSLQGIVREVRPSAKRPMVSTFMYCAETEKEALAGARKVDG